jgi:hypothetical protein
MFAAALVINNKVNVVIIKVVEPDPFLLIASECSGSRVDVWFFGERTMGTVSSVISL